MAPRFFSSRGRYIFGGTAVAAACVLVPPKETLPSSLLPPRVMLEGVGRVARCAMVGGQLYMDYALSVGPNNSQDEWDEVHIRAAHRLVRLAETNGGLYVKAGQIFANMSHILPLHYCRIMAVLQDAVVKRPFSEVQAVLEAEYGVGDVHGIFDVIDETPIAAASLAQVHRGHLRREDVEVAIKVQYIDIRQRFLGDMLTIQAMLGVAGWLFPGYDLGQIIHKLNDTVAAELDFRIEARNCARAAEDLRRGGFGDRVVCTTVCEGYTTPRVLITRFVDDAVKINDAAGMLRRGINPKEAATFFYDAMAYQIFTTGFFHGDPHAGNVLVHRSPSTGRTQVVLLDFGLCGDLSSQHKLEMSQIWASSVAHDDATLEKIARRYDCTDYALFASCFLQHPYIYYAAGAGPSGHGGKVSMEQARESMRETMKNKMSEVNAIVAAFPKEYALVLRCIMATKAINKELGEVVNRPLRFLRYALPNANSTHSVKVYYTTMLRAWWMETWSRWALFFLQWFDPTLAAELEQRTNPTAAM